MAPRIVLAGVPSAANRANSPRMDIQAKLSDALDQALDDAGARKRLKELGAHIPDKAQRTPAARRELVQNEVAHWSSVLKPNGDTAK